MKVQNFFTKYNSLIIIFCLILAAFFFIDKTLGVGVIFALFLIAVSLFLVNKAKDEEQRKILGGLFLIVFLIYIISSLFFYYTKFQPFSDGYGDYVIYQYQAEQISQRVHQGNFSVQGIELDGIFVSHIYPVILGYIYALTLPSMLLGQIFNAWLVAVSVIFVFLIIRELGGTAKQGFLTGLIACFYPSLVFYGSLLLKEALVVLLALVGLFLVIKIIKEFSILKFVLLYISLIFLFNLRIYIGCALVLAFVIGWLVVSSLKARKRIVYALIMIALFGFLPQISCQNGYFGIDFMKHYLSANTIQFYREKAYAPVNPSQVLPKEEAQKKGMEMAKSGKSLFQWPTYSADKNSSITIKTGLENPFAFVVNTSLSFLNALLAPFPWQLNKFSQALVLPEVLAWYFFLPFIVIGIIKALKTNNKIIIPIVLFSIFVYGVLAVFMNNFGIITRLRMPGLLALLCLLPLGLKKLEEINIPFLKNKV
jgi:hypothetical protein